MKEVKITIPENCEMVKEGNSYIVKQKSLKPKSWEEFCKNFPIKDSEYYIGTYSNIENYISKEPRDIENNKNICTSKEEAEAFLALMQLRQLRKAWVKDWQLDNASNVYIIAYNKSTSKMDIKQISWLFNPIFMSFPTYREAYEFLSCFGDLFEKAKIFL